MHFKELFFLGVLKSAASTLKGTYASLVDWLGLSLRNNKKKKQTTMFWTTCRLDAKLLLALNFKSLRYIVMSD